VTAFLSWLVKERNVAASAQNQALAGLRQNECLRLRVKDIDFAYRQITIRESKGSKDRVTMLPESLAQPLQAHLGHVRVLHRNDRQ
jgi:integrase